MNIRINNLNLLLSTMILFVQIPFAVVLLCTYKVLMTGNPTFYWIFAFCQLVLASLYREVSTTPYAEPTVSLMYTSSGFLFGHFLSANINIMILNYLLPGFTALLFCSVSDISNFMRLVSG